MKLSTYILGAGLLFSLNTNAQSDSSFVDTTQSSISIGLNYRLSSNAVQTQFMKNLYQGNAIIHADKAEVSAQLEDDNQLGFINQYEVKWRGNPNSIFKKYYPIVSASENLFANASFTRDIFRLTFYGNSVYEGESAVLGGTSINYSHFQTVDFGVGRRSENTTMEASLGFVKGVQSVELNIELGELYTAPDGEFIDIAINGNLFLSDTSNVGLGAMNGQGFDFNFSMDHQINETTNIQFKVNQLGLIQWNDPVQNFQVDSVFHFTGITVDNIFEIQDSVFTQETNIDSIVAEYQTTSSARRSYLPAKISLAFQKKINNWAFTLGADHYFNANYKTHLIVHPDYTLNEKLTIGGRIGLGGYTDYHFGLGASYKVPAFQVDFGADAMTGYILSGGKNQSAYIRLKYFL